MKNSTKQSSIPSSKSSHPAMISYEEALSIVLDHPGDFGTEQVDIDTARGRILADDIYADRDYPPFHRATKDGIALCHKAVDEGRTQFEIKAVIAAGTPQQKLEDHYCCMEIMTGAVLPLNADTVVMYEDIEISGGKARLKILPEKGQNIHYKGSDDQKGSLLLDSGTHVNAAEIAILATVGMKSVAVKKVPSVAVISTGNELVGISDTPLAHQIRRSNAHMLNASLSLHGILPSLHHLPDDPDLIKRELEVLIGERDVLIMSGGVSRGKFDYIPQVLKELDVQKLFHRVRQRPGKPFWYGIHKSQRCWIFSFPGNPVSTFVNYHIYFNSWLRRSLGLANPEIKVALTDDIAVEGTLTRFIRVQTSWDKGGLTAKFINSNGSGDLISLAAADGFIRLKARKQPYKSQDLVPFIPTKPYL